MGASNWEKAMKTTLQPLSIITAVHNCLDMNRLFWKSLSENTQTPFELIIVDNHSTDGSEKFFRKLAEGSQSPGQQVIYVRSEKNQSYPASQLMGMRHARYDILGFLNNDIWLPRGWELPLTQAIEEDHWLVVSPTGQETQPTQGASDRLKRRWREVTTLSRIWRFFLGRSEYERLAKSVEWMYGSLEIFRSPTMWMEPGYFNGIKGDTLLFHRDLIQRLPEVWNERIGAGDWHLYLTVAREHEKDASVPLPRVFLNSYVHHFGRYSAKQKYEPLELEKPLLPIDAVWSRDVIDRLWWGHKIPQ